MMILKTSDLRAFKANGATIKQNGILPILAYVKVEKESITKNNLESFLTQKITYDGKPFLIEEKILNNFIDNTSAEEINLIIKGNSITLSADDIASVKSDLGDLTSFPVAAEPEGDLLKFDYDILELIITASRFLSDEKDDPEYKKNAFLGNGMITASDGFIAYKATIDESFKDIYLPKSTIQGISKLASCDYSESASYHFFETPFLRYGFIKPEHKWTDLSSFFNIPIDIPSFEIDKQQIVSFNDLAIANRVSKDAITKVLIEPGAMALSMNDSSYNIEQDWRINIEGGVKGSFGYNPVLFNRLLKSIPDDKITVHQIPGRYYITGTGNYVTLIMELVK